MLEVNAVDSFCKKKLFGTTGNGEATLYLATEESSKEFIENYLGIDTSNGFNLYDYNNINRVRVKGKEMNCYITKSNIENFFIKTSSEYINFEKYRGNIQNQYYKNCEYIQGINSKEYFTIDCSLSQGRIYIGSNSDAWNTGIRGVAIPRETKIQIKNINGKEILFELI
ncbi:MAG: hypothetical protein ACRC5T_10925 [Cetobacterium sp.]